MLRSHAHRRSRVGRRTWSVPGAVAATPRRAALGAAAAWIPGAWQHAAVGVAAHPAAVEVVHTPNAALVVRVAPPIRTVDVLDARLAVPPGLAEPAAPTVIVCRAGAAHTSTADEALGTLVIRCASAVSSIARLPRCTAPGGCEAWVANDNGLIAVVGPRAIAEVEDREWFPELAASHRPEGVVADDARADALTPVSECPAVVDVRATFAVDAGSVAADFIGSAIPIVRARPAHPVDARLGHLAIGRGQTVDAEALPTTSSILAVSVAATLDAAAFSAEGLHAGTVAVDLAARRAAVRGGRTSQCHERPCEQTGDGSTPPLDHVDASSVECYQVIQPAALSRTQPPGLAT